jgi:hypothetical protein
MLLTQGAQSKRYNRGAEPSLRWTRYQAVIWRQIAQTIFMLDTVRGAEPAQRFFAKQSQFPSQESNVEMPIRKIAV